MTDRGIEMPDFGPAFGLSAEENQQRWDRMMEKHITTALETVRGAIETEMDFPCSFCRAGEREYPHHDPCDGVNALDALSTIEAELADLRMVKAAHEANVKMNDEAQAYYAKMRQAEAELTRLRREMVRRTAASADRKQMDGETIARLRAERDEAVAALREALTDARVMGHLQLQTFKTADVSSCLFL